MRQGKVKEATATTDQLMKAAPNNPLVKQLKAQVSAAAGNLEEARTLLEEAVAAGGGAGFDIVDVFRRPADVAAHVPELVAKKPRAGWMQLGIRNDEAAEALAKAGILVVQDRCLMVEYRRHAG